MKKQPEYHPLEESLFSYLMVYGDTCELRIREKSVMFNLQTAEELVDLLESYIQDRRVMQVEYLDDPEFKGPGEEFFAFIQAKQGED